jgi:uncharacterized protein YoxC
MQKIVIQILTLVIQLFNNSKIINKTIKLANKSLYIVTANHHKITHQDQLLIRLKKCKILIIKIFYLTIILIIYPTNI